MSDCVHAALADGQNGRGASAPIAILLCTFNGARFLPQQLASYEALDFTDWRVFASDDGSQDATLALLQDFQNRHGADKVHIDTRFTRHRKDGSVIPTRLMLELEYPEGGEAEAKQ